MLRRLLLTLVFVLATLPASAQAFEFGPLLIAHAARVERAISYETNVLEAREWPGITPVSFGKGGTPVVGVRGNRGIDRACVMDDVGGCHEGEVRMDLSQTPTVVFYEKASYRTEVYEISHEILEAEVDAAGQTAVNNQEAEVCDPLPWQVHWVLREPLAAFVGPSYFRRLP